MFADFDPDLPAKKTYEIDGNKIIAERTDPYGFWYLHLERGNLPEWMKGAYTTSGFAEQAINKYLDEKKKKLVTNATSTS